MKIGYRPEIDGLRALAVTAVIVYHAELMLGARKVLPGGYLGVDIFFVISGFLITSLMIRELRDTGTVSIMRFYERRIRRLLPVLITVLLVSLPFAWRYLLPEGLVEFSQSLIASLGFVSNVFWDFSAQEYGADSSLLKPLLHTWSLAVEEQYYIFFPIFFILVAPRGQRILIGSFCTLIVFSLIYADWMSLRDSSFSFFMLPSRLWEILAGSLIAAIAGHQTIRSNHLLLRLLPGIGLLLIVYSIMTIEFGPQHPGYITLLPVIGTCFIILFATKGDLVTKLLSNQFLVYLGLISYSLYLWHYPIFAFGRTINENPALLDKAVWLGLTILFSLLTYYLIEKPFRVKSRVSNMAFSLSVATSLSLLVGFSAMSIYNGGFESRIPSILRSLSSDAATPQICSGQTTICAKNESSKKKFFIVGDSHMRMLEKMLLDYSVDKKMGYIGMNSTACLYVPNMKYVEKATGKTFFSCNAKWQNRRREALLSAQPSIVVLGGRYPYYLSGKGFNNGEGGVENQSEFFYQNSNNSLSSLEERNAAFAKQYKASVTELLEHGHTVVLVYPIPEVGWHVPKVINARLIGVPFYDVESTLTEKPLDTSFDVYNVRSKKSFEVLDSIKHRNIIRIYPHELFCNNEDSGRCVSHSIDSVFYRDDDHLSDSGARLLSDKILKAIDAHESK